MAADLSKSNSNSKPLHIVIFPWLAIGHLRPFLNLSVSLAGRGHLISFISTPANLRRSVHIPPRFSRRIRLIDFPLPPVDHLPPGAESSMDVPHVKQQLLKVALDRLRPEIRSFLNEAQPKPDWIVYDYASHWLPEMAKELGISTAYFSLFTAAFMAFLGPPSVLMTRERTTAEDFTVLPEWIPFPSGMVFRLHEMSKNIEKDADGNDYSSGTSDSLRFGLSIDGSDIVIIRSYEEFEPEWFHLLNKLYQKPVIPIGALPMEDNDDDNNGSDEDWQEIKQWLDEHKPSSVVYVALGTEAVLSLEEVRELAHGLEQCGLPFFWVINRDHLVNLLPEGFVDRAAGRGIVRAKWAPQIKILEHPTIGGFVTHCGWNSATEALRFGRALILLPLMNDQGLNARLLAEKGVGIEIPRDGQDGAFTRDGVSATVRLAMACDEGRTVRDNARKMKDLFGDQKRTEKYISKLIKQMVEKE
ncbi:UDP-glycosyltransferase 91C1-like [Andrographis paniculata]|uniref:UDP-glycosyltransferase 91C1-like n=1 Tax=Andrographis paniculata TaxID=175694 RepID=UPI0021E87799|nr:UDP-glycosyltransferase 91C1-like [Andrographis paniculata]